MTQYYITLVGDDEQHDEHAADAEVDFSVEGTISKIYRLASLQTYLQEAKKV